MKRMSMLIAALMLFSTACTYDAPLTTQHDIPIDPALLGLWESVPGDDENASAPESVLVLKFSDTEYLVQHTSGSSTLHFRGYAVELAGISCVQLQVIGSGEDPVDETEGERFSVVAYELTDGLLTVSELNTDYVSSELQDTGAIRQAFVAHKDAEDLFTDPSLFKKP